jgi:hypothetical protein
LGHNSTLRQHCRQHYEIYKERCNAANVPINHYAILLKYGKMLEMAKKAKSQSTLDNLLLVDRPDTFTRDGIVHAVAQFVACDDQVSNL